MAERSSIVAAAEELGGGAIVPPRQAELGLGIPAVEPREPGKVGRPKGSRNRRTEEFIAELTEMDAVPGLASAELIRDWRRDPDELALRLGCTKKELISLVQRADELLMPYAHQKLPVAVEMDARGGLAFAIVDPRSLIEGDTGGGGPIRIGPAESEGNQGVDDGDAG